MTAKTIAKIVLPLCITLLFCFSCYVTGYPYPYYAHNYNLRRFSAQLDELSLPSDTKKIGKLYRGFGNYFGNSNKGDYVAGQLITSKLNKATLEKSYKDSHFKFAELLSDWWHKPILIDRPNPVTFTLIKVDDIDFKENNKDYSFSQYFDLNTTVTISATMFSVTKNDYISSRSNGETIYLIAIVDPQYWPDEIRCW